MVATTDISPKSGLTTFILCLFLGVFGIHRFYVGKIRTGILMLLTAGGCGFWLLYDVFSIVCRDFTDSKGRFVEIAQNSTAPKHVVMVVASIYIAIFGSVAATVSLTVRGLATVGKNELTALRLGNIQEAYSYTSADFQRGVSIEMFKKFVNSYPQLYNSISSSFSDVEFKDNNGFITGTLNMRDGYSAPIEIVLVKEYDQWKVNEINMNKATTQEATSVSHGETANPQATPEPSKTSLDQD
jgi:hypothetical protein